MEGQDYRKHDVKLLKRYFEFVRDGIKTAEIRNNDRDYHVGDTILMREYDFAKDSLSGRSVTVLVTHAVYGPMCGIEKGYVMMSIIVLSI